MGRYLSGKSVPHDLSISGVPIHSQAYVNTLSNTLSQAVTFFFTSTIGVAFAQYFFFWLSKDESDEVSKLDAPLAAAAGNPFTISVLPTWRRSPGLALTSLMMMSMIVIPIFVPASIIAVQGELTQPCNISSPNVSMAYLGQTRRSQHVVESKSTSERFRATLTDRDQLVVQGMLEGNPPEERVHCDTISTRKFAK
jgi:hypothetical protein